MLKLNLPGSAACVLTVLVLLMGASPLGAQTVLYVDDDVEVSGDCQSWGTACRWLADAIAVADDDDEVVAIHVAQGEYAPDEGESVQRGDRAASIQILRGVNLLGGFAGLGAPDPDERDIDNYVTVLTGDLERNDGPNFSGNEENSYHVVLAGQGDPETLFGGFVIRGGNADGLRPHERGGGVLVQSRGITIQGCVIEENTALLGGGIFDESDGAILIDVTIVDNAATRGGGLMSDGAPTSATGIVFRDNEAVFGGGAYADAADIVFDTIHFDRNRADFDGGGLYVIGSSPAIQHCEFDRNVAMFDGGGMYSAASEPLVDDSEFFDNFAFRGGGLFNVGGVGTVTASQFLDNFGEEGGGLYVADGQVSLTDCELSLNAGEFGAGALLAAGRLDLTQCTFVQNTATEAAGVFGIEGQLNVNGCTFRDNSAGRRAGGIGVQAVQLTVNDCTFEENTVSGFFGASGGGLHCGTGCEGTISSSTFTENSAGFGGGGLTVEVGQATISDCTFNFNASGLGGGVHLDETESVVTGCTFEGNTVGGGLANGAGLFVWQSNATVLSSVFIANTAPGSGGGLYSWASNTLVDGCTFLSNTTEDQGGGIYIEDLDIVVRRSIFAGNTAHTGGGIGNFQGNALVDNCLFTANRATGSLDEGECRSSGLGGGYSNFTGVSEIVNSTFVGNAAECDGDGGGVWWIGGQLGNCVLWGNTDGGGSDESAQVFGFAVDVNHSCIEGLTGDLGGIGNIGDDPLFRDADGVDDIPGTLDDNTRLSPGSPCIDAADNAAVPTGTDTDLDDNSRFIDDPDTEDTGSGDPPIVDMGSYEYQLDSCIGDVDGDGLVGFQDIILIIAAWGPCDDCPEDLAEPFGMIDFGDIIVVLANWGPCE